jgi:hypothetical protein
MVRITSPPALRTAPTVVRPTCPCGIATASSATERADALSTDTPVTPLGWVPVPRRISSARLRPPRTTKASSGSLSTVAGSPTQRAQHIPTCSGLYHSRGLQVFRYHPRPSGPVQSTHHDDDQRPRNPARSPRHTPPRGGGRNSSHRSRRKTRRGDQADTHPGAPTSAPRVMRWTVYCARRL